MKEATMRSAPADTNLDELLVLVEKAADTIYRLRTQVLAQEQQIKALEAAEASLRADADWCRWFHHKYENSLFFSVIEKEYRQDQLEKSREPACDAQPDLK